MQVPHSTSTSVFYLFDLQKSCNYSERLTADKGKNFKA